MASLPANDDGLQGEASPVLTLSPDEIEVRDRIGLLWPEKAAALGAMMRVDGQNDPIKVRRNGGRSAKRWRLVAGLHRLEGARIEKLPTIFAIEVAGDDHQLRAIEASENVHRRDLGPIEKALHIRALADVYEARFSDGHAGLSPQQIGARKRWQAARNKVQYRDHEKAELEALSSADTMSTLYGWQAEAAEEFGLSARRMRDYLTIHRTVIASFPALYELLARHALGHRRAAVMEIAQIGDQAKREKVIETIIADPEIKTVDEALKRAGLSDRPSLSDRDKRWSTITRVFQDMPLPEKLGLFQSPAFQDLLPAEVRKLLAPIRRDGSEARNG